MCTDMCVFMCVCVYGETLDSHNKDYWQSTFHGCVAGNPTPIPEGSKQKHTHTNKYNFRDRNTERSAAHKTIHYS